MRTTEQDSLHSNLEHKSVSDLVHGINSEDQKVADAVSEQIPSITAFIEALVPRMEQGGRCSTLVQDFGATWNSRCQRMPSNFWR